MTWIDHHRRSGELAASAALAAREGRTAESADLYRRAAEAEEQALKEVRRGKARTLGITAVSAAWLWYKSSDWNHSEQFALHQLSRTTLPEFALDQLRELIQTIWSNRALQSAGLSFSDENVLVSVRGGEVVIGGAPLDLILEKVENLKALVYRTAELLVNAPHRLRGTPSADVQQICRPWLFQAPPGSYQFALRIEQPSQLDLFRHSELAPRTITTHLLEIIRASVEDPDQELRAAVPNPEYRRTFLQLTRNLAPTGRTFSELQVRSGLSDQSPIILMPETRMAMTAALRAQREQPEAAEQSEWKELTGVLRALHLDKDWLEITIEREGGPEHVRIDDAGESVDDVVGAMVNRRVRVHVHVDRRKRHHLEDIEAAD